jgi:hypothetical protein
MRLITWTIAGKVTDYQSIKVYSMAAHRPGLAFILSDLFTAGYQEGIKLLQSKGCSVSYILRPKKSILPRQGLTPGGV